MWFCDRIIYSELVEMLIETLEEAKEIKNIDIAEALELPPIKIHCSVLAEDSIKTSDRGLRAETVINYGNIFSTRA